MVVGIFPEIDFSIVAVIEPDAVFFIPAPVCVEICQEVGDVFVEDVAVGVGNGDGPGS